MTKSVEITAPKWRPANDGTGARRWFLIREIPGQTPEYHDSADSRLIRYASYEAALRVASRLNKAQVGGQR